MISFARQVRLFLLSALFIFLASITQTTYAEEYTTISSVHGSTISMPNFMEKGVLNPAQKGLETHVFYPSPNPILIISAFGKPDSMYPLLQNRKTMVEDATLYQSNYNSPINPTYLWEKPIILTINNENVLRIQAFIPISNRIMEKYFWIYPEGNYYILFSYPKDEQQKLELTINHIVQSFKIPDQR